jgi:predicted porin
MSADDGTAGGQTWRRRSTVSLLGNWGEIRMGRDYTPTFWNLTIFDPFGTNGIGSALNNTVATLGSGSSSTTLDRVRRDNTIGYFLPSWGGVYGQFMVAAGEGKAPNKYYGGRIGYAAGPINIAGAYGMAEQDGPMVDDFTNWNIGGSWNFGGPTLSGYYGEYKYSSEKQTQYVIGLVWPIGAGSIKASWSGTSGDSALAGGGDRYSSNQYAIGYVYDLSKRTAIYAHYSSLANDGDATNGAKFTVGGAAAGANNAGPAGMKGGETSSGYQFGIRHSF